MADAMPDSCDAVVIGSGHNGLVAAAYLARAGWEVVVLERNERAGGCVDTEELTEPGFRHDTFSSWHPLFHLSAAYAELGEELASFGLEYVNTDAATAASALPGGRVVLAQRDPEATARSFSDGDRDAYLGALAEFGARADTIGELMSSELHSLAAGKLALRLGRSLGRRGALAFAAQLLAPARAWLADGFEATDVADLYAPWVLHTGLSPDDAGGSFQAVAIAGAIHQVGLPVVRGGSGGFASAFTRLIEARGGRVLCGTEAERVVVRAGRASGVVAGGRELAARRAVIANVTPPQLYGGLLASADGPPDAHRQAARFRPNRRAGMQIHVALARPPRWRDERLAEVPIVHLTDGIDGVSLACAQAAGGLLPARPTIVCGQPTALDPSRAPDGRAILWIQLQEVPYAPRGDAAGEIDAGDGSWTESLTEAYAQRVLDRVAEWIEDLPETILGWRALPPVELERRNPNLVRGDIYAGDAGLAQSYLWRPLPGYGSHSTPVDGLYQCGASTFPGPGLNAASGRVAARLALRDTSARAPARLARLARRGRAAVTEARTR